MGYIPYIERLPARPDLVCHPSDNRVELDRARHALDLAAAGGDVVVVSSGDPSVFAMSAAVFEAMETRLLLGRMLTYGPAWHHSNAGGLCCDWCALGA